MKKLSRRESYKGQNFLGVQLERWKHILFQEEFTTEEKFDLYQDDLVFLFWTKMWRHLQLDTSNIKQEL